MLIVIYSKYYTITIMSAHLFLMYLSSQHMMRWKNTIPVVLCLETWYRTSKRFQKLIRIIYGISLVHTSRLFENFHWNIWIDVLLLRWVFVFSDCSRFSHLLLQCSDDTLIGTPHFSFQKLPCSTKAVLQNKVDYNTCNCLFQLKKPLWPLLTERWLLTIKFVMSLKEQKMTTAERASFFLSCGDILWTSL